MARVGISGVEPSLLLPEREFALLIDFICLIKCSTLLVISVLLFSCGVVCFLVNLITLC
jgi:hypothetical protein